MRRRDRTILVIFIAVFLVLAVFEPSYGWRVRQWLASGTMAAGNAQGSNGSGGLAAQNEALKARLAALTSVEAEMPQEASSGIRAMVYSRYPFNFKNEILVNAGTNDGVAAGKAVTFQGVLIGTVAQAFPGSALITTVFDDNFKMPVRVGDAGYDALLSGGAAPMAGSIVRSAGVMPGDVVYAAASGVPYGLPVAVIVATSTSPDGLFTQASLGFAYDINTIQSVVIAR